LRVYFTVPIVAVTGDTPVSYHNSQHWQPFI